MMQTMRDLLSQNPMTFNELLDLFEAYVSTIGGPINKGHDMLREEIGGGDHVALGHIFGVACDAEDMAKRLCQIRTSRNAGFDVTITLAQSDANRLRYALDEFNRMLAATASAIELLHTRAINNPENEDAGARAVMALTQRALMEADEREGAVIRQFNQKLRESGAYLPFDQEDAA